MAGALVIRGEEKKNKKSFFSACHILTTAQRCRCSPDTHIHPSTLISIHPHSYPSIHTHIPSIHTHIHPSKIHISFGASDGRQLVSMATRQLPQSDGKLDARRRERPLPPETRSALRKGRKKSDGALITAHLKHWIQLFQLAPTSNAAGNTTGVVWTPTSESVSGEAPGSRGASRICTSIWNWKTTPLPRRSIITTFMQIITNKQ